MKQPVRSGTLPIGIQSFRKVRANNLHYVDKTDFALRLISEGYYYVLWRPRHFGKSLFVSMIQELFQGNRELFRGLAVHDHWDWSVRRPVVLFDFSKFKSRGEGSLDAEVGDQLARMEADAGIERRYETPSGRLRHIIDVLRRRTGQRVAFLVDDYDKPVMAALDEPALARANLNYLIGLYSVTKSSGGSLCFALLTGANKLNTTTIFSGLNNLIDVSLDAKYSSICGFTERDLDTVFAAELDGFDRDKIREWYNGYSWSGEERVYNPYDILRLLAKREYRDYWLDAGLPQFLPDAFVRRGTSMLRLEGMRAGDMLLSSVDIDDIGAAPLLFQAGCLTVSEVRRNWRDSIYYRLGYPNREVRVGLNRCLLSSLVPGLADERLEHCRDVARHIGSADFEAMERSLRAFFASIPRDWHRREEIQRYEDYCASVFCALLNGFGLDARPEKAPLLGTPDLAVRTPGGVVVFGFEEDPEKSSGGVLGQLKSKGYADKHGASGKPVHLVSLEFSAETRNVALVQWETA